MLINKIGIMCKLFYNNNNKTYNPINIIIPKHTQKVDISKINKGEKIYIKVIGFKLIKIAHLFNLLQILYLMMK